MSEKLLYNNGGVATEKNVGNVTSAGAADAGKLVALGADGKLDVTVLTSGVGPTTVAGFASEALAAGAMVTIWANSGAGIRNADASAAAAGGKIMEGYVLAAVASGAQATVYTSGVVSGLSGLTGGTVYYLSDSTAGGVTATCPTGSGKTVQRVGVALSATTLLLEKFPPIVLA